jgi:hypothetical protein
MTPFFLVLTLLALGGGLLALRRRREGGWQERIEREPWAASLRDDEEDGEPLDEDAIRRAEDAFLEERWDQDLDGDQPWN